MDMTLSREDETNATRPLAPGPMPCCATPPLASGSYPTPWRPAPASRHAAARPPTSRAASLPAPSVVPPICATPWYRGCHLCPPPWFSVLWKVVPTAVLVINSLMYPVIPKPWYETLLWPAIHVTVIGAIVLIILNTKCKGIQKNCKNLSLTLTLSDKMLLFWPV
jgi:hypothetical protein